MAHAGAGRSHQTGVSWDVRFGSEADIPSPGLSAPAIVNFRDPDQDNL